MTANLLRADRHIPVMLRDVLAHLRPAAGEVYVDGTFGAGGYTRGILETAATTVIAIDRDPTAIAAGHAMAAEHAPRLQLYHARFSDLETVLQEAGVEKVDGVVLDVGVSSMQIDQAERGFSFMRDGPLDMRMAIDGPSAADYVNELEQDELADVIFRYGEEPRSRAIARAIVAARGDAKLATTFDLVRAVERATGPQRARDRVHPATKTFQALRILVNAELDELAHALAAAERVLKEGGRLVVVTFHSLEDRIVKRFFSLRSGKTEGTSRHSPVVPDIAPASFTLPVRGHVDASDAETAVNPRSRSAKLRVGVRTSAPSWELDIAALGVPQLASGLMA
jgi:16S rRNA (cytosine1402-N4)-methyltransferase